MSTASIDKAKDVFYPESDGQPMGESYWHIAAILELFGGLTEHFRGRQDVFVAADMFLYYLEGKPYFSKCPDVMVVFGVPNHPRRVFKTWEEGAYPSVVFEITSPSTFEEDTQGKRTFYAGLGVAEYYLFDPCGETWDTPLIAYRPDASGKYDNTVPLGPDGGVDSPALGVRLVPDGMYLRVVDPATGRPIPTHEEAIRQAAEAARQAQEAAHRAEDAQQRADALDAENRRLREQLAAQQAGGTGLGDQPKND